MVPLRKPLEITLEFIGTGENREFDWTEREYRVKHTYGDEAVVRFPWQEPWLQSALGVLKVHNSNSEQELVKLGKRLQNFLDPSNWVRDTHDIEEALRAGRPVHLTIRSNNADELFYLPWELLPIESNRRFASLEDGLLQYECPPYRLESPLPAPQGRILFAYAHGGSGVPAQAHREAIIKACEETGFPFDPQEDIIEASCESLIKKLDEKDRPVTVLHLLCHGASLGNGAYGLALDSLEPSSEPNVLSATALQDRVFCRSRSLRLVTLCACMGGDVGTPAHPLGGVARMFHEQKVPAVIASRMPLSCEGSIILAENLYKELLRESGNLRTALSAVRKALKMDTKSRDWMSLQFYAHAGDQAALCPFEKSSTAPATDKAVRELVLIRHEAYKQVTTEEPDSSLAPAIFGGRQPRRVEINQTKLRRERQWKNLEAEVRRLASPEGELRRTFAEGGTDVVYYGFPYVPLAVLSGYLANKRHVDILECIGNRFSWDVQATGPHQPLKVDAQWREKGSVARLRFSVSALVGLEDCQQVLPDEDVKLDIHFRLESMGRDSVKTEDQLLSYVQVIRDTLRQYILNNNSRPESIHIFAAVPVSLAFCLGKELSGTTWLPGCFVYNYDIKDTPRYKWRLDLDAAKERKKKSVKLFK